MFRQLTKGEVKEIADIMLREVFARADIKGIKIDVTERFKVCCFSGSAMQAVRATWRTMWAMLWLMLTPGKAVQFAQRHPPLLSSHRCNPHMVPFGGAWPCTLCFQFPEADMREWDDALSSLGHRSILQPCTTWAPQPRELDALNKCLNHGPHIQLC